MYQREESHITEVFLTEVSVSRLHGAKGTDKTTSAEVHNIRGDFAPVWPPRLRPRHVSPAARLRFPGSAPRSNSLRTERARPLAEASIRAVTPSLFSESRKSSRRSSCFSGSAWKGGYKCSIWKLIVDVRYGQELRPGVSVGKALSNAI